ncbi:MAG: methionyl-tRNA formyltransferase [Vulcanimicrobiota bacterium]
MQPRSMVFIGSKELGYQILTATLEAFPGKITAVVTLDDRQDQRSCYDLLVELGQRHQLPVYTLDKPSQLAAVLTRESPDLCLVVGWYWLIPEALLNAVPAGFVAIHNSLLPRYRGGSPLVWAFLQGETEVGFSVFRLQPGLDDGPLWAQHRVPVHPDDYIGDLLARVNGAVVAAWPSVLSTIVDGQEPSPQRDHGVTFCGLRAPWMGQIDWSLPADDLERFVRAQSRPYPGAFSFYQGRKAIVWRARRFEHPYLGVPGQVLTLKPQLLVACGDHRALVLEEMEFEDGADPIQSLAIPLGSSPQTPTATTR